MASRHGTWNHGSSEPRLEAKNFETRLRRVLKILFFDFYLGPRPENLEPRAAVATATGATDRGTWNLEPTGNLEPGAPKIFEGPRLRRGRNLEPLTYSRGTLGTGTSEPRQG